MNDTSDRNRGIKKATLSFSLSALLLTCAYAATIFVAPLEAQETTDNSTNNSNNTTVTTEEQFQDCSVVVRQYNNVVAGDAVASGDAAVAETAAKVNAPVSVVNNCIQVGGDIVIGSDNNDGNNDSGNDSGNDNEGTTGSETTAPEDANCPSPTVVTEIEEETENRVVPFETAGRTFRVSYVVDIIDPDDFSFVDIDIEDDLGLVDFESVYEDQEGSFIVTEGAGSYELVTEVAPDDGAIYSVLIEDCAESTSGGGNNNGGNNNSRESSVMDGTYDETKVLANTGGATVGLVGLSPVSAVLIPSGALLVVSGVGAGLWLRRNGLAGRE